MSDKTICIIFPQGGIIPAVIMNAEKDVHVEAHKPVNVPEAYGRHLIDDRFAIETEKNAAIAEAPVKKATKKQTKTDDAEADRVAAEKAEAAKLAQIAEAEKAVADAKALLGTVGEDLAAKAEAEKMVTDAEAALAALQA